MPLSPALAVYGLFVLLPAVQIVWLALQQWNGYGPERFVGLDNFSTLWGDPEFRGSGLHTLLWEVGAAGLTLIGLGIALLVRPARAGSAFLAGFLFPVLLPQIVVAAIWTLVLSPLSGLANTVLGDAGLGRFAGDWLGDPHLALPSLFVAWAWSAVGVSALICRVALGLVGREYMEIALVEGAGAVWRFVHVTLPAGRRLMAVALLVNVALAGQVFDLIYATTGGGPGDASVTLPIDMYARAFGGRTGEGAAVALVQMMAGVAIALLAFLAIRGDAGMNSHESRPTSSHLRAVSGGTIVSTLGLSVLVTVMALPLLWLIGVALGIDGVQFGAAATLDPATWRLGSFSDVWTAGMGAAVASSLLMALAVTGTVLLLAAPAAFALSRTRSRIAVGAIVVLLTVGLFLPDSVLVIPLFSLLGTLNLLDTWWGIYLPEVARALPVGVLVIRAWWAASSSDALEAAAVDGAGWTRQLTSIAVPLALPALIGAGAWAFLTSWNEYLLPTVVSQDGSIQTVPTLLGTFVGRVDTEYAALAAGCLCALLPVGALCLVLARAGQAIVGSGREVR